MEELGARLAQSAEIARESDVHEARPLLNHLLQRLYELRWTPATAVQTEVHSEEIVIEIVDPVIWHFEELIQEQQLKPLPARVVDAGELAETVRLLHTDIDFAFKFVGDGMSADHWRRSFDEARQEHVNLLLASIEAMTEQLRTYPLDAHKTAEQLRHHKLSAAGTT